MFRIARKTFFLIFAFMFALSACGTFTFGTSPTQTVSPPTQTAPAPAKTATPAPAPRQLTICLAQEPNTLYINDNPNAAARSVLEAIYDGPVERRNYDYQPTVLEKIPSFADGDAALVPVTVTEGDWVINAAGEKIELVEGARVYPAGCREESCITTFKKDKTLQMEQMVVNFTLLPDLRWADGTPLTADDSVYAFDLALAGKNPAEKYLLERTESYEIADVSTTTWRGIPGYRDNSFMQNFWLPMPYHILNEYAPDKLPKAEIAARYPIGWGAYAIDEWIPQESLTLIKNPLYFRAAEGLPKLDLIRFRFIADPNAALVALLNGECDLLDPNIPLEGQTALLQELQADGKLSLYTSESLSVENLYLGINPAVYDDGIISGNDRPPLLSKPETRQALALCLNRQKAVDTVLHGLTAVPDSYIPNSHPLYTAELSLYSFSTAKGAALLDEIGWKDPDNDPSTPRIAYNVPTIPAGTPLELDYITTTSLQRRETSEILAESLRECGFGITLHYLPPEEFYAPGPEGILFGRQFDLAQLAIGSASLLPRCDWFGTNAIPNAKNDWVGENLSGYSNKRYDTACQNATFTLPGETSFEENYQKTLALYTEELPAIPLYPYLRIAVSRPDLCGFSLNPSEETFLSQIENLDYGDCE
jgi:peptide/nickel transport system substrate-binding protein